MAEKTPSWRSLVQQIVTLNFCRNSPDPFWLMISRRLTKRKMDTSEKVRTSPSVFQNVFLCCLLLNPLVAIIFLLLREGRGGWGTRDLKNCRFGRRHSDHSRTFSSEKSEVNPFPNSQVNENASTMALKP